MISWFARKCMSLVADVPQSDEEWAVAEAMVLAWWDEIDRGEMVP